jgi:hypothetical protein
MDRCSTQEWRFRFTPEAVFQIPGALELKVIHTCGEEQVAMLLPVWIVNNFVGLWGLLDGRINETDPVPLPVIDMMVYDKVLPENFEYLCELLSLNWKLIKQTRQEIIATLADLQLSSHEVSDRLIKIRRDYFNHFDGLSDAALKNRFNIDETESEAFFECISCKVRELSLTALFLNSQRFYEDPGVEAVLNARKDSLCSKLLFDPLLSPLAKRIAELLRGKTAEQMSNILMIDRSTDETFLKRSAEINTKLQGVREKIKNNPVEYFGVIGSKVTSVQ